MRYAIVIVIILFVASRVRAQSVVAAGICTGSMSGGVFATSAGNCGAGGVPTIANSGDTLALCVAVNSGIAGVPTVTETAHSSTVNTRISLQSSTSPALIQWMGDIINAVAQTYTISAKSDNAVSKARIGWGDLTGVTTTPFDTSGGIQVNSTLSLTLLGVTSGALAMNGEIAWECGVSLNTQTSFTVTDSNWAIPTNGQFNSSPSMVMASFVTSNTNPVVGTNFTQTSNSQSLVGMTTYIASTQPTATPSATPTATPTGPTPTVTATGTPSPLPSCTSTATATPTSTPTPIACSLPVAIAQATNVAIPTATASVSMTYPTSVTAGHLLVVLASLSGPSGLISLINDPTNGNWRSVPPCANGNNDIEGEIWHLTGSQAGSINPTVTFTTPTSGNITFLDVAGIQTSGALDTAGGCFVSTDTTLMTGTITPAVVGDFVVGLIAQNGTNTLNAILPGPPTFLTTAGATSPLNVPLYLLQDNFLTAQAVITVNGTAQDYAGQLVSFLACQQGGGGIYSPPAY